LRWGRNFFLKIKSNQIKSNQINKWVQIFFRSEEFSDILGGQLIFGRNDKTWEKGGMKFVRSSLFVNTWSQTSADFSKHPINRLLKNVVGIWVSSLIRYYREREREEDQRGFSSESQASGTDIKGFFFFLSFVWFEQLLVVVVVVMYFPFLLLGFPHLSICSTHTPHPPIDFYYFLLFFDNYWNWVLPVPTQQTRSFLHCQTHSLRDLFKISLLCRYHWYHWKEGIWCVTGSLKTGWREGYFMDNSIVQSINIYISLYIISLVLSGCDGGGRPFHPSVPSSIHPSSSSRKKKMMEEEEEIYIRTKLDQLTRSRVWSMDSDMKVSVFHHHSPHFRFSLSLSLSLSTSKVIRFVDSWDSLVIRMYSMIQLVGINHLLPHPPYVCMYLFI
jgi:hypothetical protein